SRSCDHHLDIGRVQGGSEFGSGLLVGDQSVNGFQGSEADQGFLVELGAVGQQHYAAGTGYQDALDRCFQRVRGAQAETGMQPVGADESDVGPVLGILLRGAGTAGGPGQAADATADELQGDVGTMDQGRGDGQGVGNDHQSGAGVGLDHALCEDFGGGSGIDDDRGV